MSMRYRKPKHVVGGYDVRKQKWVLEVNPLPDGRELPDSFCLTDETVNQIVEEMAKDRS